MGKINKFPKKTCGGNVLGLPPNFRSELCNTVECAKKKILFPDKNRITDDGFHLFVVVKDDDTLSGIIGMATGKDPKEAGELAEKLAKEAGIKVYTIKEWAEENKTTVAAVAKKLSGKGYSGDPADVRFVGLKAGNVVAYTQGSLSGKIGKIKVYEDMKAFRGANPAGFKFEHFEKEVGSNWPKSEKFPQFTLWPWEDMDRKTKDLLRKAGEADEADITKSSQLIIQNFIENLLKDDGTADVKAATVKSLNQYFGKDFEIYDLPKIYQPAESGSTYTGPAAPEPGETEPIDPAYELHKILNPEPPDTE